MNTTPERFYGWHIVTASFFILFVTVGVAIYSPPVFLVPLQEHFGWSRAAIATGGAIAALVSGGFSPFVGVWIDRYGARRVMTVGAILMGSAFALLGRLESLWQLYASYALAGAGVTCVAFIPNQTLISNWFVRRRGMAMGIATAGIGFGGLTIAPLSAALIDGVGWRMSFVSLSLLIFVIVVTLTLTVVRDRPSDLGLLPDGDPPEPLSLSQLSAPPPAAKPPGISLGESLKTSAFWIISIANLLFVFGGLSIIGHLVAFLDDAGFDNRFAAATLGGALGVSVGGRLLFGALADRLPPRQVMAMALILQAVATLFLLNIATRGAVPAFVVTFGLGLGGVAVLVPLLVGDNFGLRSFGKILGVIMISATIGVAVGPVLTGRIFDVTGSYNGAFALHFGAFSVAAAMVLFLRKPPLGEPSEN